MEQTAMTLPEPEGETEAEFEMDLPEVTERDRCVVTPRMVDGIAARMRRTFDATIAERDARIAELEAELAKRPAPEDLPTDEGLSLDTWAALLQRPVTLLEFEQWASRRVRRPLATWIKHCPYRAAIFEAPPTEGKKQ